jgi:energy-coupling factor transporter transmembrane protein EcfT
MRGPFGWTWTVGIGWYRPRSIYLFDGILKTLAVVLLAGSVAWAVVLVVAFRAAFGGAWIWDLLGPILFSLLLAAVAWWTPRNLARPSQVKRSTRPKSGRPPKPGTLALRQRMDADKARGGLRSGKEYLDFLLAADASTSRGSAQQIVHRELKRRQ